MRQSAVDMVRRWMALDKQLYAARGRFGGGVNRAEFARQQGVDIKTIRRDLKAFARLGYVAECQLVEDQEDLWSYRHGQQPMFTASLPTKKAPPSG